MENKNTFHVEQKNETLEACPVCNGVEHRAFLTVQDHSHSKKTFEIVECGGCGFKFTNPRPAPEYIGSYYEFEDYISHSNTNKGLLNKLYKAARSYSLVKKLQLVLRVSKKKGPILDYGCGTGEFLSVCKRAGWETLGVEPSENARESAKANHEINVITPNELDVWPQKFQAITLWHVLEHLPDLNQAFGKFNDLLLKDGSLIIAVPNPTSYEAKKYKEHWAAYDVPRHFYHFRPLDIEALAEKHGFTVTDTLPMVLDAFYISMLSEKYKTGKTRMLKAFFTGLKSNISAIKNRNTYSSQIYILKKSKA